MTTPNHNDIALPSDQNASGRSFGAEEMALIKQALDSGTLTSTKGSLVKELEAEFASMLGVHAAHACTSGSSALHTAVAAVDPEPGDEVITTSVTDMGALSAILFQTAVPVFADIDPQTYNVTAESIEKVISDRTKAIMVTHLFGNPCEMDEIMELARSKNIPVIEDCAQAYGATYKGRKIGSIGDIGCFSLQQGKHITTGEGGLVVSTNAEYSRRMFLFINKAWGYGDKNPDHYFLAPNYRMNELTGAVALGQLRKLDELVAKRLEIANAFNEGLADIEGVDRPKIDEGNVCTFWKYSVNVDPDKIDGGPVGLAGELRHYNIFSGPRYVQKPAFECQIFRDQNTFGNSKFPFNHARPEAINYRREDFAGTYEALEKVLVLPLNEAYTMEHVKFVTDSIREAAAKLTGVKA